MEKIETLKMPAMPMSQIVYGEIVCVFYRKISFCGFRNLGIYAFDITEIKNPKMF